MPWQMLHFSDIQHKPIPDQLLAFSNANLESADFLCMSICNATETATYAHGAVVMSLTFHALELFLKAAILRKAPTESFSGRAGHDLEHLYKRYSNLYPGAAMQFSMPFRRKGPDTSTLDPQVAKELLTYIDKQRKAMPEDQLHRYPINVEGEEWQALLAFEPHSFSNTLKTLKNELHALKSRIQVG
jgi:hypothetical protein